MKLSIVIPVYNEVNTLQKIIDVVKAVKLPEEIKDYEIILVDDFSKDGTRDFIKNMKDDKIIKHFHEKNYGKGRALANGIKKASGDIIIIQDADLEYDPNEYPRLLEPIFKKDADVVYGSRFAGGQMHRVLYFWHSLGNKFLTTLSNMLSDINLTDMETCYKVFKADIIKNIEIEENRFGFEPEVTAKLASETRKGKIKIFEIGISYNGRTYAEGKKIGWKDGFSALRCILKYNDTKLAESLRYLFTGVLVLFSQLISIYILVEYLGFQNTFEKNIANLISTEIGLTFAFFIHRSITWHSKKKGFAVFIEFLHFQLISIFNIILRIAIFYALSYYSKLNYIIITLISVIVVIILNFIFYRRLFNAKSKQ